MSVLTSCLVRETRGGIRVCVCGEILFLKELPRASKLELSSPSRVLAFQDILLVFISILLHLVGKASGGNDENNNK